MSDKVPEELSEPDIIDDIPSTTAVTQAKAHSPFLGFAAGICSGWTKLLVGHPFDTVKTRLQCAPAGMYKGAWDCVAKTVSKEGPRAVYKGASVPAVAWGITDSILMGSLHNYRVLLRRIGLSETNPYGPEQRLSLFGHALAGSMAGWTNAAVAHPTEVIKCKLQLQMVQPAHVPKQFKGPLDVAKQTIATQGVTGMWRGLGASFMYRTCFGVMFGSFEVFNRMFKSWEGTRFAMSPEMANFLAGGLCANVYWATALPFDNIRSRIMTDNIKSPRYKGVFDTYRQVWRETYNPTKGLWWNAAARMRNFNKGLVPVALRAFPTNAAALAVWEAVMRWSEAR
ncbi:hypothetical protein IAU60_000452 [Kwoniella sp. DSM 27419]